MGSNIVDLGAEHGHRVLRVCGRGGKAVLVPLPPAVGRAIDHAIGERASGPILLNDAAPGWTGTPQFDASSGRRGRRPDARMHPHMLRHTYATTMLDADISIRDVQIAARHADPRTTTRYDRARENLDRHANDILAAFMASGT